MRQSEMGGRAYRAPLLLSALFAAVTVIAAQTPTTSYELSIGDGTAPTPPAAVIVPTPLPYYIYTNLLNTAGWTSCAGNQFSAAATCRSISVTDSQGSWYRTSGTIPTELGTLTMLTSFNLHSTLVNSTIPTEIGKLTSLRSLSITGNWRLSGTVPTEFGLLTALTSVSFYDGILGFPFPTEVGNLPVLRTLNGCGNPFEAIPTEIGNVGATLRSLTFCSADLTGALPSEMGMLTSMTFLDVSSNGLTTFPTEFGNMDSISHLILSSNKFVKEGVPDEWGGIGDSLITLEWNSNPSVGPTLPTQLGSLSALSFLYMNSGSYEMLPTEIGFCTSLNTLHMNGDPAARSHRVEQFTAL
jgi:Leucine-rich repeat (LRR) protein